MTQNPLSIITQKIDSSKIDIDKLIWYIMYCYESAEPTLDKKDIENHHILPRKLFPEFKNLNEFNWNSSKLPKRKHIIAHYLLAEALKIQSTLAAFNMMKRALKNIENVEEISILYEEYRDSFSELFRNINLGRKQSDSQKLNTSIRSKGMLPVIDPKFPEHAFTVSVNDPRYLSGELISETTGRIHTEETKQLMYINGIKGKVKICEIDGIDSKYITESDIVPDGWKIGDSKQIEIARDRFTAAEHWYNPITNEQFRVKPCDDIPTGAIKGRSPIVPNIFIDNIFRKNFKTGEIITTKELSFSIYCGSTTAKLAFIFENKITFNIDILLKHFPTKLNKSTLHRLIYQKTESKIYHHKTGIDIRDYLKKYNYYNEIPLQILPISEVVDLVTEENWLQ